MTLILIQIAIFGAVFFEMFCRLKTTDGETIWQVRWAISAVAMTSFANILSVFIWVQYKYELMLMFGLSIAIMQWAMARQWKKAAPKAFDGIASRF
ncbi:hypothetical protein UFOVP275_19 [uncultured Caudovirales phage]|uniref:Uncharacterized protein n=1 Tax=uncultured Caudovirales phage TaxID=2100421 RepID=A0A6J5LKT2_9CAUD|nr:hypothetical protein UFOVP275_19 [uncultured Caudovirales phage]